jgi:HAE1 family hydrophobic/amphiphilic exporter-1
MLKQLYKNPVTVILICLFVLGAGLTRFFTLPVALYPDATKPTLNVSLRPQSVEPEDFMERYGYDIENKLLGVSGVDDVNASYWRGHFSWNASFGWNMDKEKAEADVKAALAGYQAQFPKEWGDFFYRYQSNSSAQIFISITSKAYANSELYDALRGTLKPAMERVSGVDQAFITKESEEIIRVELLSDQLLALAVSPDQVLRALQESEQDHAFPTLEASYGASFPISIPRKQRSLDDLRQLVVVQRGEKLVRLTDVADVRIDSELPHSMFKSNGKLGLLVGATVKEGANIAETCNEIRRLTIEASRVIDPNIEVDVLVNPSEFIQEAIVNIGQAIFSGICIATLIIFLFLGSIRFTAIIAIAIPLSLIGGFIVMSASGIELNLISLGAMALAVGMVVDGSIVVLENIHRRLRESKPVSMEERLEVLTAAMVEVRGAVIAGLFTTIIVFSPLAYTAPLANAILGDLAKVMVCVLVISILVTILVVPALMMFAGSNSEHRTNGIYAASAAFMRGVDSLECGYLATLRFLLRRKAASALLLLLCVGALLGSLWVLGSQVRREILATPDTDRVILFCEFPHQEYSVQRADEIAQPYEQILLDEFSKDVLHVMTQVQRNHVLFLCSLADKSRVKVVKEQMEARFVNKPKIHFHVFPWNPTQLEIPNPPIVRLHVSAADGDSKRAVLESILNTVQGLDGVGRVNAQPGTNKSNNFSLRYKEELLHHLQANAGFSRVAVEEMISLAIKERFVKNLTLSGSDPMPLRLGYPKGVIGSPDEIGNLQVSLQDKILPVRHLLDIQSEPRWKSWYSVRGHEDYFLEIFANSTMEGRREELRETLMEKLADFKNISFDDTDAEINENINSLLLAMALSLCCIWILISLQFGGLWQTLVIMMAIPLGFIGVGFSLYAFNSTLSVNSMLGLILLCGTAVNNSILFVDFYNGLGYKDQTEALLETARLRLRPILITTATTILGMIPIAVGYGSGGEILQPLGIAICGGLGVSTCLTLLVIPIVLSFQVKRVSASALVILLLCGSMQVEGMNLREAEQWAVAADPGLEALGHGAAALDYEKSTHRGELFPEVSYNQGLSSPIMKAERTHTSRIRITENIPNPWVYKSESKILGLRSERNHLDQQRACDKRLYDVRVAYMEVLRLQQEMGNRKKIISLIKEALDVTQHRFDEGFIHRGELLRLQTHYDRQSAELSAFQQKLPIAKYRLALLTGSVEEFDVLGSLDLKEHLSLIEWQESELRAALVAADTPSLRASRIARDQQGHEITKAKARFFPNFFVNADIPITNEEATYSVGLTWNFYSGGKDYHSYCRSMEKHQQALSELEEVSQNQELFLQQLLSNLIGIRQELNANRKTLSSLEELLEISRRRQSEGHISAKEFGDDMVTYLQTQEEQVQQVYRLTLTFAEFSRELSQPELFHRIFSTPTDQKL